MSSYLFVKYREDRCSNCLRATMCAWTEHDILLCSSAAYFKGPFDEKLLSKEEKVEIDKKRTKE